MRDLKDHRAMFLKAALFLVIGTVTATLLLAESWSWKTALLLALLVWSFCRAYYFAFYVLERYVDPDFKFSGLGSLVAYLWRRKK